MFLVRLDFAAKCVDNSPVPGGLCGARQSWPEVRWTLTRLLLRFLVMVLLAMSIAPAQTDQKIDVNLASVSELQKLPGITAELAHKIVSERPYSKAADLSRAGLSPAQIQHITLLIKLSAVQPEKPGPQGGSVASGIPRKDPRQERSQVAQGDADRVKRELQAHEAEKERLRSRLLEQLNTVLETRDTARGLIVNISDVLFDTGKATLKPGAREKLAKIAGIMLAHPGLKLEVEGYTDSVGGDEYNQSLSERRADSVRGFLVTQGIPDTAVTARGFGKTRPAASNDTAAGRQMNRRVELVVSGEAISAQTP
jgi:outer membrane protein OmpA-like peptidoglycan-associated protein